MDGTGSGRGRARTLGFLAAAIAGIVLFSLSIHVVMLQVLDIDTPDASGIGRWRQAVPWAQAFGLVALAAAMVPSLRGRGFVVRWLAVAALFGALNGLLRNALMAGVVTTAYAGSLGGLVFQALLFLVLAAVAVAGVSRTSSVAARIGLAVGVGALWLYVLLRGLGTLLSPLLAWSGRHAGPEVYTVPYGANVLIPSYLSFAETVIACVLVRYLGSFPERGWDRHGLLRFAAVVLLARGTLAMTLVWGPMIGSSPADGLLSASQFFLQDVAMVLLVHLLFRKAPASVRRAARPGA